MLPSESSRYTVWRGSFRQCPIDFRMLPWRVGSSYSLRTRHFSDSHWFRRLTRASRPATQPTPYGRGAPACPSESGRLGLKLGGMRKKWGFGEFLVGLRRLCSGPWRWAACVNQCRGQWSAESPSSAERTKNARSAESARLALAACRDQ